MSKQFTQNEIVHPCAYQHEVVIDYILPQIHRIENGVAPESAAAPCVSWRISTSYILHPF